MRCLGRLVALVMLLMLGAGVWAWREGWIAWPVRGSVEGRPAEEVREPPTEALAASAEAKLERLRTAHADRVALGSAELESMLRYRHAGLLPGFIDDPRILMEGDRLRLSGRVPAEQLPRIRDLAAVLPLMPDTVEVRLTGRLSPLDDRRAALSVDILELGGVPVPQRLVRPLLDRLGRGGADGLPHDAIAVPLPPGVRSLYVRADSLVLTRHGGDAATAEN